MKVWHRTLIIGLGSVLAVLMLANDTYAEYYLVYPDPVVWVYRTPHYPCYRRRVHRVRYHAYRPRRPRSDYHISVYYLCQPCGGCPCAYGPPPWVATPADADYWAPPRYVPSRYDPDLSTGDDNAFVHPAMQIN